MYPCWHTFIARCDRPIPLLFAGQQPGVACRLPGVVAGRRGGCGAERGRTAVILPSYLGWQGHGVTVGTGEMAAGIRGRRRTADDALRVSKTAQVALVVAYGLATSIWTRLRHHASIHTVITIIIVIGFSRPDLGRAWKCFVQWRLWRGLLDNR